MTDPEQVLVNVADLEALSVWQRDGGTWVKAPTATISHLVAAIPEPEWEPTDEMRAKYRRAKGWPDASDADVDDDLRNLHREGLL